VAAEERNGPMIKLLSIRSFKMKLLFTIWIGSAATLVLACGCFIFLEVVQFDNDLIKELKLLSDFIADKSAPAIMFNDPSIAEDALLSAVAIEPAIVNAVIYDAEANVVATYARDLPDNKGFAIPEPRQNTSFIKDAHLHFFGDIDLYSDRVGTVYIHAERQVLYERLQRYGVIVASILAVSLLFLVPISFILQNRVSTPILALIASAKQVSEKKDYGIRVKKHSDDELGVFADVFNEMLTQIQKSDRDLRESRELFEEMASNIPGVIYQFYATPEEEYGFSYISKRAEEIIGISSGTDGFYERFLACVDNDDRAAFSASIAEAVRVVGTWEFEGKFTKPSGEKRWFRGISRSIMKDSLFVANGVVIDITERKRAEAALRESEERYRLLFNSANDAVFVHQPSTDGNPHKFLEVNDIACKMYGYKKEALLEMTPPDLVAPEQEAAVRRFIKKTLSAGHSVFEIAHKTKEGNAFPVEISAFSFDFHGQPTVLSIVRDITDRKRAEEDRVQLEAQLQQAQKMESIGTLAGGIAHDFNNILGIILGNTELAIDDVPEWNPARHSLEEIRIASLRAKDVVRQLLSFARKTKLENKPTNIIPIVKESLKLMRSSIPKSIEFRHHIAENIDTILADSTQINQVFINLCTNADHAMPGGGVIEVSLRNVAFDKDTATKYPGMIPGRYVNLSVSDTGQGISQEDIDRIFDPYFTTKEVGKGTGMGLAVVHGIVKGHNGIISVESELGRGTTFSIFFPTVEKDAVVETESNEKLPTGDERILFIDDEESIAKLGRQGLERLGYTVEAMTGPVEALARFRSQPDKFGLVITDLTMPKMTGDTLVKEILSIRSDTPIILCTGFSEKVDEKKAKEIGAADYIEKPLDMRNFARIVRKVLDAA
jgi:PAS domain S-box-containing protein